MSEEAELASPAAAIVARRESRMPERLKVSAPDDSPDDDWDPEEGAGASDDRRTAMQRTVVQMAARSVVA